MFTSTPLSRHSRQEHPLQVLRREGALQELDLSRIGQSAQLVGGLLCHDGEAPHKGQQRFGAPRGDLSAADDEGPLVRQIKEQRERNPETAA